MTTVGLMATSWHAHIWTQWGKGQFPKHTPPGESNLRSNLQAEVLIPIWKLKSESGQICLEPYQDAAFSAGKARGTVCSRSMHHVEFTGCVFKPGKLQLLETRRPTKRECLENTNVQNHEHKSHTLIYIWQCSSNLTNKTSKFWPTFFKFHVNCWIPSCPETGRNNKLSCMHESFCKHHCVKSFLLCGFFFRLASRAFPLRSSHSTHRFWSCFFVAGGR